MDAVTRAVSTGEDLYGLLGVARDASGDEIRHAYRSLARRHHPDANPDEAGEGFQRVAAAYEVLGDREQRAAYDRALRLEEMAEARFVRPGPVASHVAPRPTGATSSRGRAHSANPADRAPRVAADRPEPPRAPTDEWRLVGVLGRVVAAGLAALFVAAIVLMVVAANASEPEVPPARIWCKTPDGWYSCWEATSPN